ncbi:hypothetical protein [Nocardia vulneris]|uniref:SCO6045-like C-terminal domain-containing protein n=1 Tax=Nocardia vulneris TaxID=1141657 RepID=A0ABR4ZMG6_9NOCA|nr:hypothetical protein [Nocardia vulneris]KIA66425.1 hypothetical protein FG87_02250 [Nocardia vulneris]
MSAELAEQQAALVRALVAGAPVPAGFDRTDVAAAAHALLRKRADEVARRFPMLAQACGPEYRTRFLAWADGRPKTSTAADATAFAASLGLPAPFGSTATRWSRR